VRGTDRPPGLSVRLKLTLSYAGFLVIAGVAVIAVVWVFLLRYVPTRAARIPPDQLDRTTPNPQLFFPGRADLWAAFAPKAGLMLAALLLIGLVGGWILAGMMLAPLNRITDATRQAAHGSLSHRIRLEGPADEFRELADAFDDMLAQLEAHIEAQRRFAANASHELRTPLAVTQALLDVGQKTDSPHDRDALLGRLRDVNTRAIDLVEALLILSRTEHAFAREPVDLSLVVEEAVETLLPLAEKNGVVIDATGEVALALGSHPLLQQVAVNLLHNAIVHNIPEHGQVRIDPVAGIDSAGFTIENTGERLDPNLIPTLTEPFRRGTERIHRDHAGTGLGLAIVKSIVTAHGGSLVIAPGAAGGLRITVRLPAAEPRTSSQYRTTHAFRTTDQPPATTEQPPAAARDNERGGEHTHPDPGRLLR